MCRDPRLISVQSRETRVLRLPCRSLLGTYHNKLFLQVNLCSTMLIQDICKACSDCNKQEKNYINTGYIQVHSQTGFEVTTHHPKSAKRSTFSHIMDQKLGFGKRVKGWGLKSPLFGSHASPKLIQMAIGLVISCGKWKSGCNNLLASCSLGI